MTSPNGHRMRQVPMKHTWSATLWISKDGEAWKRYFNPVNGEWHWDEDGSVSPAEGDGGAMGLYLDRGFTALEVVIALAWLHREPNTPMRVEMKEGKPPHAKYIRWVEMEEHEEEVTINGEKWTPLRRWRCGLVPCTEGYEISNHGRLKSPSREVTSGFWFEGIAGPTRLAAVKDCGLVDLWVAAKLIVAAVYLKPYVKLTVDAMVTGKTPRDLMQVPGVSIQLDTAWSYFRQAAEFMPPRLLWQVAERVVDMHLLKLLLQMKKEQDERLGGQLNPLMEVVQDRLPLRSEFWKVEGQMGMLAFARLAVVKVGGV